MLRALASGGYIAVNRHLIARIGLHSAVLLGELAGRQTYTERVGKTTEDGYFVADVGSIERATGLSAHRQRKALDALSGLGAVEVDYRGTPRRRYIRVLESGVFALFCDDEEPEESAEFVENSAETDEETSENVENSVQSLNYLTTGGEKIEQLAAKKLNDYSLNYLTNIYKNKHKYKHKYKHKGGAKPPTLQEVRVFVENSGIGDFVDPEVFVRYYESQGWRKANGQRLSSWKAAARGWAARERKKAKEQTPAAFAAYDVKGELYRGDD